MRSVNTRPPVICPKCKTATFVPPNTLVVTCSNPKCGERIKIGSPTLQR